MAVFSIIVPVYNVEKEIRQCLDSLKNQTFGDFEVYCVDDCGKDSSMEIVREFAQSDSRFKILTHEHNKGVSAARNTALDVIKSDYTMFVDSDDWLEPNALEYVNNTFNKVNTDIVMFNLYTCLPDGTRQVFDMGEAARDEVHIKLEEVFMKSFVGVIWNRAYKTSIIKENNLRFPEGKIIEDSEFTFKVATHVDTLFLSTKPLYNYRVNREGSYTTKDITNDRITDELDVLKRCYDYAKERGIERNYRKYFLQEVVNKNDKILKLTHHRRLILEKLGEFLKAIDFPNSFKDMEKKRLTLWME